MQPNQVIVEAVIYGMAASAIGIAITILAAYIYDAWKGRNK